MSFDKVEYGKTYYASPKRQEALKEYLSRPDVHEQILKNSRKWSKDNPEKRRKSIIDSAQKNPKWTWTHSTIHNHRGRGFVINFTREELYQKIKNIDLCPFCDRLLDWMPYNGAGKHGLRVSLDRIDNAMEITLESVQILCWRCNATKSNRTQKEFIDYCRAIVTKADLGILK